MRFWGHRGLQTASDLKFYGPNSMCYHVCLGCFDLFNFDRRWKKEERINQLTSTSPVGFAAGKKYFIIYQLYVPNSALAREWIGTFTNFHTSFALPASSIIPKGLGKSNFSNSSTNGIKITQDLESLIKETTQYTENDGGKRERER